MADSFTLKVSWKNDDREFEAELRQLGYTYKIAVWVDGMEIIFEPDEERNFRALVPPETKESALPNKQLLLAISQELENHLK